MRDGGIEICIVDEGKGGSLSWAEEVEMEHPSWTWFKDQIVEKESEKAGVKKKRVKRGRDAPLKSTPSYPYEMRVGAYLAWRKGPEEMRKLEKEGVTKQKLEDKFMEPILRKPGICQNPSIEESRRFDVEKLDEEAVKNLIRRCASGPKINSRYNPASGKNEHYIVLQAMSPVQGDIRRVVERKADKEEEQQSHSDSEPRPEVNIFNQHFDIVLVLGARPGVQGEGGGGGKTQAVPKDAEK